MLLIDGHLDLAMNALNWNRDLRRGVHEIRAQEAGEGMTEKGRAAGTVSFPALRRAEAVVSLATVIARVQQPESRLPGYRTHEIAYAQAQGQLAYYRELERQGVLRLLTDWAALQRQLDDWRADPATTPLGIILCMEGADPIVAPEQARAWWDDGLRVVGLAHYGPSAYAKGTEAAGPLSDKGRELLAEMERLGLILDLSHLTDQSFWEALERFHGTVLASHSNCRALVPGDRQLSDEMIRALVEREAVIGAVLDAWMLALDWVRGVTTNEHVTLEAVVDNIDHVCQLAGDARHAAIGSDLDGGYGIEQTPNDLDTIVDLQKIPELLRRRGYGEADIEGIMYRNWLSLFQRAWV